MIDTKLNLAFLTNMVISLIFAQSRLKPLYFFLFFYTSFFNYAFKYRFRIYTLKCVQIHSLHKAKTSYIFKRREYNPFCLFNNYILCLFSPLFLTSSFQSPPRPLPLSVSDVSLPLSLSLTNAGDLPFSPLTTPG
jgi:hypothetical protein